MNMFYPTYKNTKNDKAKPQIDELSEPENYYYLDPDLKKIIDASIESNNYNNEVCYYLDEMAQSFGQMVAANIVGRGVKVSVKNNPEATAKIRAFNNHINNNNEQLSDLIRDMWIDNLIFGFSLQRVGHMQKGPSDENVGDIELLRIPPRTITINRDPINGWRKFVQTPANYINYGTYSNFMQMIIPPIGSVTPQINIPDDPRICLYVSLFRRPPMNAINKYIVLKNWITWFIKKYSEKLWSPLLLAFVGDQNNYPISSEEMQEDLDNTTDVLRQLKNFANASFPGNTRIEVIEPKNNGEIYLKFMESMDARIMSGLFGSMALRESTGVYKGAAAPDEQLIHFLENVRDSIEFAIKRFYIYNIVPGLTMEEIELTWTELRSGQLKDIVKAFEIGCENIVFKNAQERRKALAQVFPSLMDDELTPKEMADMDALFEKIKSPSQPKGVESDNKNKSSADDQVPGEQDVP